MTGFALVQDPSGSFCEFILLQVAQADTDGSLLCIATSSQVTGRLFAANDLGATPAALTTAVDDSNAAYVLAAGEPGPDFINLAGGAIGGLTLVAG